ncbi:MAG TPA: NEW3 domain-containing protein [Gemmatimonadaceae bacterium]|nr:NEW3 domain-containing protein [Gemmatimonadaceae bacterium]
MFALIPCVARAAAHVELAQSASLIETQNGALVAKPLNGITKPGQRVRYTIVAHNTGDHPAASLAPVVKIPAGERYVDGTAGTNAEYSVDAGKTWSATPMVRVTNPGGVTTQRRALPAEFDAIRWTAAVPLAPGARMTFAYDVIFE